MIGWKGFGVRFLIAIVILGGLYALFYNLKPRQTAPPTAKQTMAAVRADLDENYIAGNALADFDLSDASAAIELDKAHSAFEGALAKFNKSYGRLPANAGQDLRRSLGEVLDRQKQAGADFKARYKVLGPAIHYDPATDLGLAIDSTDGRLAARVNAAHLGLSRAANNVEPLLIEDATRQSLRAEIDCLQRLSNQLNGHLWPQAAVTRQECIDVYPELRHRAIQNVTQPSMGPNYQTFMDDRVPKLLKQLDRLTA